VRSGGLFGSRLAPRNREGVPSGLMFLKVTKTQLLA
jgi:hypothetical protein